MAVPGPFPDLLEYSGSGPMPSPGMRARAPLGHRQVVGVICAVRSTPEHQGKLRPVLEILDLAPVLPTDVLQLALWAARYYQHPPGDALAGLVPRAVSDARAPRPRVCWELVPESPPDAKRTPARARAYDAFKGLLNNTAASATNVTSADLAMAGVSASRLRDLVQHGHAVAAASERSSDGTAAGPSAERQAAALSDRIHDSSAPTLTQDQATVLADMAGHGQHFNAYLLQGVTGSGKTEVYLRVIRDVIAAGGQALVLVPEIALTPQTVERFALRFPRTEASHSGLSPGARATLWRGAAAGTVDVVVGTRSAIFTPMPRLGVIVVDEEHDGSFKQQDGFRYSARDLAVKRARDLDIPVLLGSATPALESLLNVARGRYRSVFLNSRPGGAALPRLRVLDVRGERLDEGLSPPLLRAIGTRLAAGEQALLFLNRRGFAPTLLCHGCGWVAGCPACDARLTAHLTPRRLVCHHCDHQASWPALCPQCGRTDLQHQGLGTQRIELALQRHFPDVPIVRVDRDIASSAKRLQAQFDVIRNGAPAILVGTQMLAKGHHFPAVTLSAVINADAGLLSADFRAPERTAQLIIQVAGRAGRTGRNGELWLQTYQPDHPIIQALQRGGYAEFATLALKERREAQLPPYAAMAVFRADATDAQRVESALQALRVLARTLPEVQNGQVSVHGPVAAPLPRRASRFRFQLALMSADRSTLHKVVGALRAAADKTDRRHVRIGVDIDPIDLY